MKRLGLGLAAAMAMMLAVACSSGGGGGSGSPTPTPGTAKWTYTIDGTGFGGFNGNTVGVRIYQGTTVALCSTAGTVSGNHFTLTLTSALQDNVAYHGEVFVDNNANAMFDTGEPSYYDPSTNTAGTFTVTTNRSWAIVRTSSQGISWPSGTGCQ